MSHRQEVVVVDGVPETAQVLRAVLEPRGLNVSRRTSRPDSHDDSSESSPLLVLHDVTDPAIDGPCVIVGRIARPSDAPSDRESDASTIASNENERRALPLPFRYEDLVAAIDAVMEPAA